MSALPTFWYVVAGIATVPAIQILTSFLGDLWNSVVDVANLSQTEDLFASGQTETPPALDVLESLVRMPCDPPKTKTLRVEPVWLEDAPVFRMRVIWPPMSNPWNGSGTPLGPLHGFLRAGTSWPNQLVVHQPDWSKISQTRSTPNKKTATSATVESTTIVAR